MSIQRCPHDRKHPYAIISKNVIFNTQLKPRARLLLITLLSLPDDWKVYPKEIAKRIGYNIDTVYDCLKELAAAGYCRIVGKMNEKGHRQTSEYFISEIALPQEKSLVGKKPTGKTKTILSNEATGQSKEKQQHTAPPKPAASVVVFSSPIEERLRALGTTEADRKNWAKNKYTQDAIEQALAVTDEQPRDNPLRFFRGALKEKWMPTSKILSLPDVIRNYFKHGESYNGADCWMNGDGIGFTRGITHVGVKFNEFGFAGKFKVILATFGIKMPIQP